MIKKRWQRPQRAPHVQPASTAEGKANLLSPDLATQDTTALNRRAFLTRPRKVYMAILDRAQRVPTVLQRVEQQRHVQRAHSLLNREQRVMLFARHAQKESIVIVKA